MSRPERTGVPELAGHAFSDMLAMAPEPADYDPIPVPHRVRAGENLERVRYAGGRIMRCSGALIRAKRVWSAGCGRHETVNREPDAIVGPRSVYVASTGLCYGCRQLESEEVARRRVVPEASDGGGRRRVGPAR